MVIKESKITEEMDNMKQNKAAGHLAALLTIFIWGTTFISTKVLLRDFQPVEILFFRFVIGLAALAAACPRRMKGTTLRQELAFASAGLSGYVGGAYRSAELVCRFRERR